MSALSSALFVHGRVFCLFRFFFMPQEELLLFFVTKLLLNGVHMTVELEGEVLLFISRQRSSLNILQVHACHV